jgi:ABC-type dipeptide/oligopeptide/nickel transport system permease subunit
MIAVYICSLLQEVVIILLSFPSLVVAVHMFSFIGSGSHIVIIPLTDGSCVYILLFYRKWF